MEDSFRVRADKVFGSLGGITASSVGVSSSLWCLGDEEIERREWNRNKDYAEEEGDGGLESGPPDVRKPLDSDLQDLSEDEEDEEEEEEEEEGEEIDGGKKKRLDSDLQDLSDDEEDEEEEEEDEEIDGGKKKRRRNNSTSAETSVDGYFDVQSNIGRDCTLDYEEEEDQFDKVAVGSEHNGDRLYMRDVKFADYEIYELNEYSELPNTFQAVVRDPRANHAAAKIRLKEDAESAGNLYTLQLSDTSASTNAETEDPKKRESDGDNPKPILKKRENLMDSRSQKHVRFVFDPKSSTQIHEDQQEASEPCAGEDAVQEHASSDLSLYSSGVPDYLRNPSKYTFYAFDDSSDDMDDQSNRKAYMDFFDNMRRRNTDSPMEDTSVETPKSVVFTPRRKTEEGSHSTGDDNLKNKMWFAGITAAGSQESEISAMEEDEPFRAVDEGRSSLKAGRQYRARANADVDVDVDVDDNSN